MKENFANVIDGVVRINRPWPDSRDEAGPFAGAEHVQPHVPECSTQSQNESEGMPVLAAPGISNRRHKFLVFYVAADLRARGVRFNY